MKRWDEYNEKNEKESEDRLKKAQKLAGKRPNEYEAMNLRVTKRWEEKGRKMQTKSKKEKKSV